MYIHGGRDLKEGPLCSLWRINLTKVQQLQQGSQQNVGWEQIATSEKNNIGKISHHKCGMISANEVAFFGGNRVEGASDKVHVLNLVNNTWSVRTISVSLNPLSADCVGCCR